MHRVAPRRRPCQGGEMRRSLAKLAGEQRSRPCPVQEGATSEAHRAQRALASTTEVSICRSEMLQYLRSSRSISGPGQEPVAVFLVEADRPGGGAPGTDQDRLRSRAFKVLQQFLADAFAALRGLHVGVADEADLAAVLDAHHAEERAARLVAPARDAIA